MDVTLLHPFFVGAAVVVAVVVVVEVVEVVEVVVVVSGVDKPAATKQWMHSILVSLRQSNIDTHRNKT